MHFVISVQYEGIYARQANKIKVGDPGLPGCGCRSPGHDGKIKVSVTSDVDLFLQQIGRIKEIADFISL